MLKVLKLRIYKKFNNKVDIKNYLGKAETIYVVGKYSLGLPLIYHLHSYMLTHQCVYNFNFRSLFVYNFPIFFTINDLRYLFLFTKILH
jgi:hypothetical protein